MNKSNFMTAAVVAVAQAVNTREFMHSITTELVSDNLAQTTTAAEAEGCGETPRGQPVAYHGPTEYAPSLRQNLTPAMTLAQTAGISGEAAPTPMEMNFAQATSKSRSKASSTRGNPFNSRGNLAQVSQSN